MGKPTRYPRVMAPNGMVVACHQLAASAGIDILENGGTAVDACVAGSAVAHTLHQDRRGPDDRIASMIWHPQYTEPRVLFDRVERTWIRLLREFGSRSVSDLIHGSEAYKPVSSWDRADAREGPTIPEAAETATTFKARIRRAATENRLESGPAPSDAQEPAVVHPAITLGEYTLHLLGSRHWCDLFASVLVEASLLGEAGLGDEARYLDWLVRIVAGVAHKAQVGASATPDPPPNTAGVESHCRPLEKAGGSRGRGDVAGQGCVVAVDHRGIAAALVDWHGHAGSADNAVEAGVGMVMHGGRLQLAFAAEESPVNAGSGLQALLNWLLRRMNVQQAVEAPRFVLDATIAGAMSRRDVAGPTGQATPSEFQVALRIEDRIPRDVVDGLGLGGYTLCPISAWSSRIGHAQAIAVDWECGMLTGGIDPRSGGLANGY